MSKIIDISQEVFSSNIFPGDPSPSKRSLLSIKKLKPKQKVRGDFQINDADDGKERSRLIHWNSGKDNTYVDASSWGDGLVVDLDAELEADDE